MSRPEPRPPGQAYLDALKLLGRRELSETQVRQRLARKGHSPADIDAAVARLLSDRTIDDVRTAEAIAHTESVIKRHGRLRVMLAIERAGIAAVTARRAVDSVGGGVGEDALLERLLTTRLRGRDHIADRREFQRLYRYLVGQGFEADRVMAALTARRR